jgi:acyl-coenzyme A thioesterase PaaI-like protein
MSDIPTDPLSAPYHGLFGCGLCKWRDGCARLFAEVVPRHLNRAGVMHGGVGRGLIDQAAASFGLWCCVPGDARRGMTRTLATQYRRAGHHWTGGGGGRRVGRGGTTFGTRAEVFRANGTLVAMGQRTHRSRSGSGTVEGMPVAEMT